MKIATFNANSIRMRVPIIVDWLNTHKPDVLCIQETKVRDTHFPLDAFEECGYRINFRGMKSYNGVALFSRTPPTDVHYGFDEQSSEEDQARLLHATWEGVHIVNTYVPQGYLIESPKYAYKLAWYQKLRTYFETHFKPTDLVIWCGDVNVAPEAIDVHHPENHLTHVCFHEDAKKAYGTALSWGFTDVFRKKYPDVQQFTFWDYRARPGSKSALEANLGWRIDHILATAPLANKCTHVEIDIEPRKKTSPSDHTFLWAEFDI